MYPPGAPVVGQASEIQLESTALADSVRVCSTLVSFVRCATRPKGSADPRLSSLNFPLSASGLPSPVSVPVAFEFRTFETPESGKRELAAWCTLVDRESISGGSVKIHFDSSSLGSRYAYRLSIFGQFLQAVAKRLALGTKQFIRFSMPATADQELAMLEIDTFASQWLQIRS